jgi:hypothetical protein
MNCMPHIPSLALCVYIPKRGFLFSIFVYTISIMAKRHNGVGNMKTTRSTKTTKRLAIKKEMIARTALKKNNRRYVAQNV